MTSEPPRGAAEATGSRQEVATVVAATVAATVALAVPPVPVPTAVDQAAVVEIPVGVLDRQHTKGSTRSR
jgi:hypothetical protein